MSDQILAKNKLVKEEYSYVVVKDENVILTSNKKGIEPLLNNLIEDKMILKGTTVADKVIGKAVALLLTYGGVKSVYGHVISDCAKAILDKNNVEVEYNRIVPYIMNEDGTDKCSIEKLIEHTEEPIEAFSILKDFFTNDSSLTGK